MTTTFNADLSSVTTRESDEKLMVLPGYNPSTLTPFSTEAQVLAYIGTVLGDERFWSSPSAPQSYRKQVTPAEFRNSFSAFEEVAIKDFAEGPPPSEDPEAPVDDPQTATLRKVVGVFFDRLLQPSLTVVDLEAAPNLAGLDLLVSIGVLTPARRDAIAQGLPG